MLLQLQLQLVTFPCSIVVFNHYATLNRSYFYRYVLSETSSFMSRRLRFYLHKVISSSAFLSAQFYLVNHDTNLAC
jgi:hypothetical protein